LALASDGEFEFTVTASHNGVPIPESEIELKPFEPGSAPWHTEEDSSSQSGPTMRHRMKSKRANPIAYSNNWCGSVRKTTGTNKIKKLHAYFQHPGCSKRTGVTQYPQATAVWGGIDGDSWTSALLQAGTVCKIDNSTGIVRHEAWWQWVPNAAYTITSMPIAAGDWFEVEIDTKSTTSARVTLINQSQGFNYTMNPSGGQTLGRMDADWVIERPYYGSSLAGFASFTQVWFEDAYATLTTGGSMGILGAKQFHISGMCESVEYDDSHMYASSL